MDYNRVWDDEARRAMDVLAAEITVERTIDDHLVLKVPVETWTKMFNVAEGYVPCDNQWKPFGKAVVLRFTRINPEIPRSVN